MIMKRFWLISMLLIGSQLRGNACAHDVTYNYYLFHTWAEPENYYLRAADASEWDNHNSDRVHQFWCDYMGKKCNYLYDRDEIEERAKQKGDKEVLDYMKLLDEYMAVSEIINHESWEYPTKEELAESKTKCRKLFAAAQNYQGTRLKPQYALLQMRANMVMDQHQANVEYWEKTGSKQPKSVFREMMENIYAGALFHTGQREKACDIFARQGDSESIQWALRKYRNVAGIRRIYADNPNSHSLYYLVDEFVNDVQETIDGQNIFHDWDNESKLDAEGLKAKRLFFSEVDAFIQLVDQVVAEGKTKDPLMWVTARGMVNYEVGRQSAAQQDMERAAKLKGREKSQDVYRCVNMLIMTANPQMSSSKMLEELTWLRDKAKKDIQSGHDYDGYHHRAIQRVVLIGLAKRYHDQGNHTMENSLHGFYQNLVYTSERTNDDAETSDWNENYSGEYFYGLDTLTATQLVKYYDELLRPHSDPLEKMIVESVPANPDYFNDLIGTKYLADGKIEQAASYLEKVPAKFYEGLNVSYYLAHRDYHKERWMVQQRSKKDVEGINKGRFTQNPKLAFCQEVLKLQDTYKKAKPGLVRYQTAYKLGTMIFQASSAGECWPLSRYGKSYGTDFEGHFDSKTGNWSNYDALGVMARSYLEESAKSADFDLRVRSLYGLAYMPFDNWADAEYHWNNGNGFYTYTPNRNSLQYAALKKLNQCVKGSANPTPAYVTKCDVLKKFRKYQ